MSHRILYVHNSADIYGASRSLLRLLPRMTARGFEALVVLPEGGPLQERIERLGDGVRVIVDRGLSIVDRAAFGSAQGVARFALGFPGSVLRLRRLIRREGIALVHTNTGVMPSPALAARLSGVPHVWHIRDSFQEFRSLWSIYRRYITTLSRRVLCVSHPIAAQFPGAGNVAVIHNGMPLEEFPRESDALGAEFRARHGLGDALVVGCVGRIKFVRKGQEILVQAMARLRDRGIQARCLIVGSVSTGNEDHLERLRQLIRDLKLESGTVLTGELADPKPAYAAMDVFVLPSAQPEPFGGVVLEAMAMRRPVIATAIGGSLDQVADGQTGFLIPPGDPEALADKLNLLLREPDLRKQMGEAGRSRLERLFTIETMLQSIEEVYRQILPRA